MHVLSLDDIRTGNVPSHWRGRIRPEGRGLRIDGDHTGATDTFLHASSHGLAIATRASEIVAHLRAIGAPVRLDRDAICFLLQTGFVAYPRTIFAGVQLLGIGDVAHVSAPDGIPQLRFEVDFPYFRERSREDQKADPRVLRDHIAEAMIRATAGDSNPVLLMSSGKDSTALALGASVAGLRDLHCLTFVAGVAADEHVLARRFCDQLGLRHSAVPLPQTPQLVARQLEALYAGSDLPCADSSQIAYHACLAEAGVHDGTVLDGTGDDIYMGNVPGRRDLRILRLSLGRSALTDRLRPFVDHASRANYFLQTRAEIMFPGYYLRHLETRRFFEPSIDTSPFWKQATLAYRTRDIFDFRAVIRGRHYAQGSMVLKARGAVQARESTLQQPFTDAALIDYYFHLPERDRFDRHALVNKVTLRKMLRSEMGYDDVAIGKRVFSTNTADFLLRNRAFVLDQICGCPLWSSAVEPLVRRWIDALPRRPRFGQALMALLGLSGWVNHARILGGEVPEVVAHPIDASP